MTLETSPEKLRELADDIEVVLRSAELPEDYDRCAQAAEAVRRLAAVKDITSRAASRPDEYSADERTTLAAVAALIDGVEQP